MTIVDQQNKSNKNIEAIYPLSSMQQGMLFHTLYAPESEVYLQQTACTLAGNLNVSAFEQTWQRIVERHSIWRTLFVWENRKQPLQVVRKQVDLPWTNLDWRSLSQSEQQERLEALLVAERKQGFKLDQAPLLRCVLVRLQEDVFEFVISYHHLLLDGWSLPIVFKEFFALYEAYNRGQNLYLPPPRPYREYISWLQQQDISAAETFWRQTLQGFTAPTPLVVDRASGQHKSHHQGTYQEQYLQLSAKVTADLRSLVGQHRLTVATLVQGAWAILLSRYSGESDIVFGATVSGRSTFLGAESMVGLFINTLPIRVQVSGEVEVLPLLQQLQNQQVESQQYSYSSLVEIQGWSEVPRGTPLFESIVVFENYPVDASLQNPHDSLQITNARSVSKTNYPLTVVATLGQELSVWICYDRDRFEPDTIVRMAGHFQTILEAIAAHPEQQLAQLPLLSDRERQQLTVEWNNTQIHYPVSQCLHQSFEEQVRQTPDAVAVVCEDQRLTYRELNSRSNQLAHYLRSLGVGPEVLVGICVERSLDMMVGLLGILKAGGAYLPLDPDYPKERLSYTLNDAGVSVLLTQQRLVELFPEIKVVCIDTDWDAIATFSPANAVSGAAPNNLAYVIYTSGSTGQPKGVLVNHQQVVRLFAATQSWFQFSATDVWTLFHSIAFDFSVWEIWGALLYGGRLVIVPYWVSREPQAFYSLLHQERVTVLNQTPSAFGQLMQEELASPNQELSLRWVIFGGEALEPQSLQPWFERHGEREPQLVNMYGITETTVHVTYKPLTSADVKGKGSIIGVAIPDLQVYILDERLQPVPIGVKGEMYVGGAGVARGYLNRPELTQEKFIPNPFSNVGLGENKDVPAERQDEKSNNPKSCLGKVGIVTETAKTPTFRKTQNPKSNRLYKTGDLARYLPDGNIEFLGRIDNQVKIRGFRIELGEIEAILAAHPQVRQAVVIVREDTPGEKRLVAYLVPSSSELTTSELRSFLKQKLPEYMVPAVLVLLEVLPLTSNGKVDRRALPSPNIEFSGSTGFVPPRNATEEAIAGIIAEVLNVEKVGIHDNFFELGGHSLLATQLISRLRKTFSIELPIRAIFESATVAELAEIVVAEQLQQADDDAIAQILAEVDGMSENEVKQQLSD